MHTRQILYDCDDTTLSLVIAKGHFIANDTLHFNVRARNYSLINKAFRWEMPVVNRRYNINTGHVRDCVVNMALFNLS